MLVSYNDHHYNSVICDCQQSTMPYKQCTVDCLIQDMGMRNLFSAWAYSQFCNINRLMFLLLYLPQMDSYSSFQHFLNVSFSLLENQLIPSDIKCGMYTQVMWLTFTYTVV